MADYLDAIRQMDAGDEPATPESQGSQAPQDPYLGVVQQMASETQSSATDTLLAAQQSKPDAAGRAMTLAPQVGVPAPAVEADLPAYEQQAQLQKNRQIMAQNPVLAQWVAANPMAARVAQDDFDKLDYISQLSTALKTGADAALAQNQLGRLYSDKALAGTGMTAAPSSQDLAGAEQNAAQAQTLQLHGLMGGVQQVGGFVAGMFDNFLHARTEMASGMAMGAAVGAAGGMTAGGVGAVPGAIAGAVSGGALGFGLGWKADMARVQYGLTYRTLDQMHDEAGNPLSETAKQAGAALSGALTFGLAQAGGAAAGRVTQAAVQPFVADAVSEAMARPTVQAALRNFTLAAARGGVEGAALNAGMEAASIAGEELGKQISPGQFNTVFNDPQTRQAAITRLADAAESGALLFGGMHMAGASLGLAGDMLRVRQSQADMQTFQNLQDGAAASATRDRNLQAFQSFMQSQLDGSPAENLYVPAERIAQVYQQHGVEPGQGDPLFGFVPDMRQQLEQAGPVGGDVVIPTADYLTHMAGTDVSRELLPDIRVRQDGMSLNDAQQFYQSSDINLRRDAHALAGMDEPAKQIYDDVSRQAQEAGYSQGAAQRYATLFAARYAARGERLGIDPQELYRQAGLELQPADAEGEPPEGEQYEQALKAQPPRGWGHSADGADAQALWDGTLKDESGKAPKAVFWTGLDGKLEQDAPDIAGYSHSFSADAAEHVRGRHGNAKVEAERGQIAVTGSDIAQIPDIVTQYDAMRSDLRTEQGARRIAYAKRVNDGVLVYIEDVSRKRQDLRGVTMWKYPPEADEGKVLEHAVEGDEPRNEAQKQKAQQAGPSGQEKQADSDHESDAQLTSPDDALRPLSDYESDAQTPPSDQILPSEGGEFNQEKGSSARGSITFGDGRTIIKLFQSRDLSTLLHEAGHLFLEEMRADAQRPDAPEQIRQDMDTIRKWMGVDSDAQIKTEHHEQFARAAEAYFLEGKAPSGALAAAFRAFKNWLTALYRNVAALNTPINDEIRGVFDRMLATDDEIAGAQQAQGLRANFQDAASAGMTDREFSEYQKTLSRASGEADSQMLNRVMEHVRGRRTSDYEAYRNKVKAEVTAEVDARPDIQALESLRAGAIDDGSGGKIKIGKLNAKAVDDAYGAGTTETLPRNTTVKRGGAHPDDLADVLGFSSGQDLVQKLAALEQQERDIRQTPGERRTARQYIIDRRTDFRMSEEKPDILEDGSIRDAAIEAIHNQEMQKALQIELRTLGRRIHQEAFSQQDARDWARDQINERTVRDVQATGKYSRAEAKAARMVERALLEGDHAAAFRYKQQQVLNHHLFVAAKEANEEIQSGSKELNRYANKRKIPGLAQEYLDQIHGLLDRFDFGDASQKEVARRKSLRDWAERQMANGAELDIAPELLSDAFSKHFSDLTVSEFRGVRDAVENIAHLGQLKQTLLDGADVRDFDAVVKEAVGQTDKMPKLATPTERNPGVGGRGLDRINAKWLNAKSGLRSFDASMLKMEQVFDWLDGGNENGVFNRVVFRRLADAGVRENDLRARVVKSLQDLHKALPEDATRDWLNRYELPELIDRHTEQPSSMLKKDIIAMALNVGNESNFAKLMNGEGWSRQAVMTVLNRHLSEADWHFVQGAWDLIETLWPDIEAMEKRLSGVAPDKVRPTPVTTKFGTFRGGYYPAIYDPLRGYQAELNRQRSGDRLFENNYTRAATQKGHTIERIDEYAAPLYLNLDVLPRHLTGVIHDLAYREAIIDSDRFLADSRIREAVENTLGREVYKQFRPWLQSIANDKVYDQRGLAWWDRAAHWARTSTTLVGLGFRMTTMMIHGLTAASNSVGELGPRWMMSGVSAFFGSPQKMAAARDFVFERSGEMRNRMNEVDRDIRDALREMESAGDRNPAQRVYDGARRFAYFGISMLDMGSALPTWIGAYNKGMHEGLSEQDAVYSADKAVRNAHGGGGTKDLAAIQRGSEFQKLFTMFYSFWNHFYNRQRDIARRAVAAGRTAAEGDYGQAARDFGMVLARSWWYFVLPQLIHAAIKPAASNQQNEESWPAWAAKEVGLGLFSGVPVARDIANSALTGRSYVATPAAQIFTTALAEGKDIAAATGLSDKDLSPHWVKHAIETSGYVFGLPTGQASNAGQFLWDVMDGEQDPQGIQDFLHGLIYGKVQ